MKSGRPLLFVMCALVALLVVALFAWRTRKSTPLPNDAYVWQRKWTPDVTEAMRKSERFVRTWHVLVAEYDHIGENGYRRADVVPDWQALAGGNRPVIAVFRIDGSIKHWDDAALATDIAARLDAWRGHGVAPVGVEIDYDCGTARLASYTRFLRVLRPMLGRTIPLSITALPTWLGSADLDALLASSDEAVLQLHAVMSPVQGLFDAARAQLWMTAFAQHTQHPWRIALPAYGTRVTWNRQGRIVAVESEAPALYPGGIAQELVAAPDAIRAFVMRVDRAPPHGLSGIVWFRLPVDADARAWSFPTWRAVLARAELSPRLAVIARPGDAMGLYDVLLDNTGNTDAVLPRTVHIASACLAADGMNGYVLDDDAQGLLLQRSQPGLLRAGTQLDIGWLRCDANRRHEVVLHVQP